MGRRHMTDLRFIRHNGFNRERGQPTAKKASTVNGQLSTGQTARIGYRLNLIGGRHVPKPPIFQHATTPSITSCLGRGTGGVPVRLSGVSRPLEAGSVGNLQPTPARCTFNPVEHCRRIRPRRLRAFRQSPGHRVRLSCRDRRMPGARDGGRNHPRGHCKPNNRALPAM